MAVSSFCQPLTQASTKYTKGGTQVKRPRKSGAVDGGLHVLLLRRARTRHTLAVTVESIVDILVEHIHLCLGELPRADTLLEEQVQLRKSPASRFGHAEVGIDNTEEADSTLGCLVSISRPTMPEGSRPLTQKKPA